MNNSKNFLKTSIMASAIVAAAGFNANANSLFNFKTLGTGESVRTTLLGKNSSQKSIELKCGADSSASKMKDGKCGEGKCGNKKAKMKKNAKDGKCGNKSMSDSSKMKSM